VVKEDRGALDDELEEQLGWFGADRV